MSSQWIRRVRLKLYGAYDGSVDIVALHRYHLLYFAVPKVANTSIKVLLARIIDAERQVEAERGGGKSSFLRDPAQREGLYRDKVLLNKHALQPFRHYDAWAFVRNPWDRLVSCYSDKVMRDSIHQGVASSLARHGDYAPKMEFADFAQAVCSMGEREANRHFRSQYTFLIDRRGALIPKQIGYFETLQGDFATMCGQHGIPTSDLPSFKATHHRPYRDYYTDELRAAVAERYGRDIELFGYTF